MHREKPRTSNVRRKQATKTRQAKRRNIIVLYGIILHNIFFRLFMLFFSSNGFRYYVFLPAVFSSSAGFFRIPPDIYAWRYFVYFGWLFSHFALCLELFRGEKTKRHKLSQYDWLIVQVIMSLEYRLLFVCLLISSLPRMASKTLVESRGAR